MEATRTYHNLTVKVEARDQVELFKQLAMADEVFGNLTARAMIDGKLVESQDVSFVVRTDSQGNDYYEARCNSGPLEGYKKRFGQHKVGRTLFPRIQPAEGEVAGLAGWSKYVKGGDSRHGTVDDF